MLRALSILYITAFIFTPFRSHADIRPYTHDFVCEGDYGGHLQGVCTDEREAIYWSFTTEMVKTDRLGKILKRVPAVSHHGDLCFHRGKIYVAVNLGQFNNPEGKADSWIYVYQPDTLELLEKHAVPEVFHGAGGMDVRGDHFYVVGGLPNGVEENYVYEYDATFQFVTRHVIMSGWTNVGIQTAAWHDDAWWFGCYGSPNVLLKTDAAFQMLGRYDFEAALGIVGVANDRFLVARDVTTEDKRYRGVLHRAHPDPSQGLVLLPSVISVQDTDRVARSEGWQVGESRFAATSYLATTVDGAALDFEFEGTGVAIRFGGHETPAYAAPNLGIVEVSLDGAPGKRYYPRAEPRELVLADGLEPGAHHVRIVHLRDGERAGCRVESFQTWSEPRGAICFQVDGEENAFLVDCRAILRRNGTIVRNTLVRNWLTGQCSLTGLAPGDGYTLEIVASGWKTHGTKAFEVVANQTHELAPVFLHRKPDTVIERFRFPRLNQPAVKKPGEQFNARFLGFDAAIESIRLTRSVGPATISRDVGFEEDTAAAYYYDREIVATIPADMPPGLYDLKVFLSSPSRGGVCHSPRSVHVVPSYPVDPVFFSFGHLDTSGQYQAEYVARLAEMANLLAPDAILCSNAANAAYVSGALAHLSMPYVINFGNHQVPGHEAWYGETIHRIYFGPELSILNVSPPWHAAAAHAEALLAATPETALTVINAFEPNAPLDLLDRFQVPMIHDAHGPGERVEDWGATPTKRIGKVNSESFRLIRFRDGRVASCTYNGDRIAPIPFSRSSEPPIRVAYDHPNDGALSANATTITNDLLETYPNARLEFVLTAGSYRANGGRLESSVASDDGRFQVVAVRFDIPAENLVRVSLEPDR